MAKESHYCKEEADFAVAFIENLKHTKGTWYDEPFELIDWQEQIIRDITSVEDVKGRGMYVEVLAKEVQPSGKG